MIRRVLQPDVCDAMFLSSALDEGNPKNLNSSYVFRNVFKFRDVDDSHSWVIGLSDKVNFIVIARLVVTCKVKNI